jgi:hypothetical protein
VKAIIFLKNPKNVGQTRTSISPFPEGTALSPNLLRSHSSDGSVSILGPSQPRSRGPIRPSTVPYILHCVSQLPL